MTDFNNIAHAFNLGGEVHGCHAHGSGHIHDTYLLEMQAGATSSRYILQRLNTHVFRKPEAIQDNLRRILDYLKKGTRKNTDPEVADLELIDARNGNNFFEDASGSYWRCFRYIEGTYILKHVHEPEQAYEGARLFGHFTGRLKDYNARRLHITIPDFLNIEFRLQQLMIAQMANPVGRMKHASQDFEKILEHQSISREFSRLRIALPDRVTHNDTKISNVLFSKETNKAVSVIDLDTVMTGTLLTDFGDMVRTFTVEHEEDETELEKIRCNPVFFDGLVSGYFQSVVEFITEVETANLLLGAKLMIFMQTIRFLTDFLNGDVYYKVSYPVQNLDRARNQMKLLESLLDQQDILQGLINKQI